MYKPEWGTKRTCPKTGERFYDLGKDDPVTSPSGHTWYPEPILKSKQPLAFEQVKTEEKVPDADLEGGEEDIAAITGENEEPSADDEVDLGGDDDLGVETGTEDEEH